MSESLVSTQEVAVMLNVAETTIKRWADGNVLPCVRTPGGHRKFRLNDVIRLAETEGFTIGGSRPPPMTSEQLEQLETGVHTRNYARVAGVFREKILQGDREGVLALLLYLYKQHIPLAVIMDDVIRPAFDVIGTKWEQGEIKINQEHAASHVAMEALIRMAPELHRKDPNTLSAVCACLDGELHEIGLRGLAYVLECEGWKTHYVGPITPSEDLASFIRVFRPDLLCLSLATGKNRGDLKGKLQRLASQVHSYGGKMIIGGGYAANVDKVEVRCDHISQSIQDGVAFTRTAFGLKPGPKKKTVLKSNHRTKHAHKQHQRQGSIS